MRRKQFYRTQKMVFSVLTCKCGTTLEQVPKQNIVPYICEFE